MFGFFEGFDIYSNDDNNQEMCKSANKCSYFFAKLTIHKK